MIQIYKNKDNKLVTKGAYETFYKPLGYKVVIEENKVKRDEVQLDTKNSSPRGTRVSSNKKNKEGE